MLNETPGFLGPFGPGGFDFPDGITDDLEDVIGGGADDDGAPTDDDAADGDGADELPDAGDGDVTTDEPDGSGGILIPSGGGGAIGTITLPTKTFIIPENFGTGLVGGPSASTFQGVETTFNGVSTSFQGISTSFNGPDFVSGDFGGAIGVEEPESPFDFSDAIFDPSIDFPVFFDDVPGSPGDIDIGETVTAFIADLTDVDLFEISFTAGQTVIIDAFATETSTLDTLLAVIDPFGNTLVENDDFNIFESFDSKIIFTAPETATFTLAVGGFVSSVGEYGLSVAAFEDSLTDVQELALLYEAAFGRSADFGGLNFWLNALQGGASLQSIAEQFIASDEFVGLFGDIDTLSDTAIVTTFFENVLDRPPDDGGLEFFLGVLDQPDVDEADLLVSFALSPENLTSSPEVLLLETDASGDVPPDNDFFLIGDLLF
ncbi:MAG: DUF4214 domain-containing protein [Pseudomonadota bacterium]